MSQNEQDALIAEFLRKKSITRCPTACALPTQAAPVAADQAALQRYAARRSQSRRQQVAGRDRSFWATKVLVGHGD